MTPPKHGAGTTPSRGARLCSWLGLLLALAILNFTLTFHNLWPTPWVTTRHELSVEIAALVLLLAAYSELVRPPSRAAVRWLAALVGMLAVGRYAEVTAPALYGRPINLYWDATHLPAVAAMLTETMSSWRLLAYVIALTALLAAVFWLIHRALLRVRDSLQAATQRRFVAACAGLTIALYAVGHAGWPLRTLGWFSLPVTATYARQADFIARAVADNGSRAELPPSDAAQAFEHSRLRAVAGADVLVVFLESYGAAAYDTPSIARRLEASRQRLEAAATASGRRIASAFVESPTFGGVSWLAHMSLMSGTDVADGRRYELLLTQERRTLSSHFGTHGYRTLALMPGLRNAWPEGAFYDFDEILGAARLDYPGPDFGWWRIPDQYALAQLHALELDRADRAPVFTLFTTISSHMPFHPVPPYEPDWSGLTGPQPYDLPSQAPQPTPSWADLRPAYARTVDYALTWLAGYLRQPARRDAVIVVLGDHQPAASVAGQQARWDVPVHVITNRRGIIDTLLDSGFAAGPTPPQAPVARMHELTALLLNAFDGPDSGCEDC